MERVSPNKKPNGGGLYFEQPTTSLEFISSGCSLLDQILGGGWPLRRISNVIGDASTGKTLMGIEAMANFARQFPKGKMFYREGEFAFDENYAASLGLPLDRVELWDHNKKPFDTVEDFFEDLNAQAARCAKENVPGFYALDSLDSLSDRAEMKREIDKGSYGASKAKQLSEIFRRLVRPVGLANMHLMIISQVRDNIGVMFGDKFTVSGGRALKFYASQRVMLSQIKPIKKTVKSVERAVGIRIRAKAIKNKIGVAQRECEFVIRFGYGIDDYRAGLEWLVDHKRLDALGVTKIEAAELLDDSWDWDGATYRKHNQEMARLVPQVWQQIEKTFSPPHRKYE